MYRGASANMTTRTVPCCCLYFRKRKRLRTDTCAEAREVLVSLSGPYFVQMIMNLCCVVAARGIFVE